MTRNRAAYQSQMMSAFLYKKNPDAFTTYGNASTYDITHIVRLLSTEYAESITDVGVIERILKECRGGDCLANAINTVIGHGAYLRIHSERTRAMRQSSATL